MNALKKMKRPPSARGAICYRKVALATLPEAIYPGAIVVENDKIADVGKDAELYKRWKTRAKIIDASGYIVLPGLINCHTHAAMGFFRDRAHGRPEMIEKFFFPMEKKLSPDLIEPLSYSFLYASLTSGTTAIADHYYFIDGVAKALNRFHLRGVVGETIGDLGGAFPSESAWHTAREKLARWKFGSLVRPSIAPHAADTVSEKLLSEMASYARANNLCLHMHLAQSSGESARVRKESGLSPVEKADRAGAIAPNSLLVHMVEASRSDLDLVKRADAAICLSPASQILYERLAPLADFMEKEIPLTLGTDCAASNDGADLFSEMRLTALLLQDRMGKASPSIARDVFRMCTETAGQRLFQGETGALQSGLAADLVFLKHSLANAPIADLYTNIVFSCSSRQVDKVMVAGRWLLWDRKLVEISEDLLQKSYTKAVATILKRTHLPQELAPLPIEMP